MNGTILVVDDDRDSAELVARILRQRDYHVGLAHSGAEALDAVARLVPDVVLMDLMLPDADGSELVASLRPTYPSSRFIIVTGHGSIEAAVRCTRHGAIDFLTKPVEPEAILVAIRNAMQGIAMEAEVERLRQRSEGSHPARVTKPLNRYRSAAMGDVMLQAALAADREGIVLLLGESGTGKDHMARWIHRHSARSAGPFFSINCAALPPELAEAELFGHEPGAYTGARGRKRGLLELAERGTLLLDEIGELDRRLQAKLLTFLDTRTFLRVGGERTIRVDARLFAATNRDLAAEVERGIFRGDLYYRLNVLPIHIPPLRDRAEDMPTLVAELLERLTSEMALPFRPRVRDDALELLATGQWRGNVRELRNSLERALMLSDDGELRAEHFQVERSQDGFRLSVEFPDGNGKSLHDVTRDVARALVAEALRRGGNKTAAARLLRISRHALAYQLSSLGLDE